MQFELLVQRRLGREDLAKVVVILEQEEVSDRRHRSHYLLDDILHDVVGIVSDFVFTCAAVQDTALVFGSRANIGLQEGLDDHASVRSRSHKKHDILRIVYLEVWLAVVRARYDF